MLINKKYYEDVKTEKAWFDSSMFFYTEAIEYEDKNCVDLYVTFKNGATYKYKEVALEDYVLLVAGGTDASQGKTLNKIIKPKYEFERVEDKSIDLLREELEHLNDEIKTDKNKISNTYFISGHRDIEDNDFEFYYQTKLNQIVDDNPDAYFVVGDYEGVDIMAQDYLINVLRFDPNRITVYHMSDTPKHINSQIKNTVGGFTSHEERDSAMTNASFEDVAFVKDNTKISGTAQNILRRYLMS